MLNWFLRGWALLSLLILYFSIDSALNYGLDPKHCDGNYIIPSYTYPNFQSSREELNKRYQLVRHHEEGLKEPGIPILFLPGNAGTYKQMRTFGSVIKRIWGWGWKDLGLPPVQLYSIETREELTAFESDAIKDQAYFANEALHYILSSYGPKELPTLPTSVIVIGHSMGGLVAREIFRLDSYKKDSILNLFTLATPHTESPIPLYRRLSDIYTDNNQFWRINSQVGGLMENLMMISIAGGNRDTILDSSLTEIRKIADENNTLHVHSSGAPHIWTSADHEGVVWCDQILHSLSDAVYKLYSSPNQTVSARLSSMADIFKNHKRLDLKEEPTILFDMYHVSFISDGFLQLPQIKTFSEETRTMALPFKSYNVPGIEFRLLTDIPTSNIKVFGCTKQSDYQCRPLTSVLFNLPFPFDDSFEIYLKNKTTARFYRRPEWIASRVPVQSLTDLDTIILQVLPNSEGFLFADYNFVEANTKVYDNFKTSVLGREWATVNPISVLTTLKFPTFKDRVFKYKFTFKPNNMEHNSFPPRLMQRVGNEVKGIVGHKPTTLSFFTDIDDPANNGLEIDVWMDPADCSFDYTISIDYYGSLSLFTGRYKTLLISQCFSILLYLYADLLLNQDFGIQSFKRILYSPMYPLVYSFSIVFYFYNPANDLLVGKHQFLWIGILSWVTTLALGIVQVLLTVFKFLFVSIAKVGFRYRALVLNKSIRYILVVVLPSLGLIFPLSIVFHCILAYALLVCLTGSTNQDRIAFYQLAFATLLLLSIYQVPHTLNYVRTGAVYYYIDDLWKMIVQLVFVLFVFPFPTKRTLDLRLVVYLMSAVVMVFGWKHTYVVDELTHGFILVLVGLEVKTLRILFQVKGQRSEDEENKID